MVSSQYQLHAETISSLKSNYFEGASLAFIGIFLSAMCTYPGPGACPWCSFVSSMYYKGLGPIGNLHMHAPQISREVRTPNIDMLVAEGIELDRAYVYKCCSPTRSINTLYLPSDSHGELVYWVCFASDQLSNPAATRSTWCRLINAANSATNSRPHHRR